MSISHSSYTSIDSLRLLLKDIDYIYKDTKPTLEFYGTVKLHGTNAGIGFDGQNLWSQSRTNIITIQKDNAGFAFFVDLNKEHIIKLMETLRNAYSIDFDSNYIVLFGEWCGSGIQKKVGISQFDKMFFVFDLKVISKENKEKNYYINTILPEIKSSPENRIYNIHEFKTYSIQLDMNNLEKVQTEIEQIISEVEANCPVTEALGKSGIGEGVVFRHYFDKSSRFVFKAKGELHSVSKNKEKVPIKVEKNQNLIQFVSNTATENRFEQALEHIYRLNPELPTYNKPYEMKDIRCVMEWIRDDILKEERDTIKINRFDSKELYSEIGKIVVEMFKRII